MTNVASDKSRSKNTHDTDTNNILCHVTSLTNVESDEIKSEGKNTHDGL